MQVIIIGGGIGGLATALMLHARGIDCEIYEQSDAVRELGVGINTLPHAIRELAELGLLDRLDAVAVRTYELFYTNRFGQEIWREPRGTDAGYEYPQFSVHRGRLQGVIYDAVRSRLGESRIHTGHRLGAFTQDDAGVTAYFFDRNGSHRATARGDVLVGADGIHSAVRASLFGPGAPRFTGKICWRCLVPVEAVPGGMSSNDNATWLGPHGAIVVYRVRRGELINVVSHFDDETYKHESWITPCDRAEVIERYSGWHESLVRLFSVLPPRYSSGMPTTAASRIVGCLSRYSSTSRGHTLKPEALIMSFARSTT